MENVREAEKTVSTSVCQFMPPQEPPSKTRTQQAHPAAHVWAALMG